ncbi:uncharacterized protein LOC116010098 [Ipomoea triloba]|uniref:uncharacterized protein LOC116010098 n=1 Tax=Ipomoea triloba TaxID=35885 RepID=UPI00125D6BB1|nr:uncharacterized protein LOC116010098 [Ipomoea triloba]
MDGVLPGDVVLDSVEMWVQLHDLPMGYTSELIQEQIGNFLGKFVMCDDRFTGAPWLNFYRIRVALPVDKPIKRKMKLLKRDRTYSWVTFRYERLHNYCFFCGMLGHSYKFCLKARESTIPIDQYPFGADLRAGHSRGPRAVGEKWLVPVGGLPLPDAVPTPPSGSSADDAVGTVTGAVVEAEVVAVSKRRREGPPAALRRRGSGSSDVAMHDMSKNLHMAGSSSQARPSS